MNGLVLLRRVQATAELVPTPHLQLDTAKALVAVKDGDLAL